MKTLPLRTVLAAFILGPVGHAWSADQLPPSDKNHLSEVVVVTAEKRAEPIQKAPVAIVAIGGAELQVREIKSLVDLTGSLPSTQFESDGYSAHLFFRGVGSGQDRINLDPLIGVTMDGVPLPREMQATSQYDVNDIELLPGPQGTLYGGGAVSGAVNITNNVPTDRNETFAAVEFGNYALVHTTLVQNVRATSDLSVRAAVDYTSHSAYETGGFWKGDILNGRIAALYKPSDAFSADFWMQGTHDGGTPQAGTALSTKGFDDPKNPWNVTDCQSVTCNGIAPGSALYGGPSYAHIDNFIAAGKLDWALDGFTLTDTPSLVYDHVDTRSYFSPLPIVYIVNDHQLANELRATSDSNSNLKWIAGLYTFHNNGNQSFVIGDYLVPRYSLDTVAAYGQATYSINSRLRVTGGVRYTWDRKDITYTEPGPFAADSATWSNVDWKIGLEGDVTPKSLAYATISTSSEPGTLDGSNAVNGRPNVTTSTNLLAFTVGSKNKFFDNRLELNDELYYYDYRHFLIQTLIATACPVTGQAGCVVDGLFNPNKMVIYGDQLDLRWHPTDADRLSVGIAFNHARTENFISPLGVNLDNLAPIDAPDLTITLGASHVFDIGNDQTLILRANSRFESGYFTDFETAPNSCVHCPGLTQHAFTNSSMSLTYYPPSGRWTAGLWVKNVENGAQLSTVVRFATAPSFAGSTDINEPRTYGARVTFRFQ